MQFQKYPIIHIYFVGSPKATSEFYSAFEVDMPGNLNTFILQSVSVIRLTNCTRCYKKVFHKLFHILQWIVTGVIGK